MIHLMPNILLYYIKNYTFFTRKIENIAVIDGGKYAFKLICVSFIAVNKQMLSMNLNEPTATDYFFKFLPTKKVDL